MEIFEVLPIVSFRGMSTGIPIFGPEIDQKVGKIAANCCTPDFLLCSGDLNPILGLCFRYFPCFSRENFHQGRNLRNWAEAKVWSLWRLYIQSFYVFWSSSALRGISRILV
jgi:hypothetical protein